jgi:hypothetical protein
MDARVAQEGAITDAIADLQAAKVEAQGEGLELIDSQITSLQASLDQAQQEIRAQQAELPQ